MAKFWFIVLLLVCSFCLQAQINLVPNASFEQFISCPNNTSQVDSCIGWHSVLESPDYYNTCAPYPVSIPDNFCGYQGSFDGNGYMGLVTYAWFTFAREIFGTTLIDTMVIGNVYNISMRVSRGNWTNQNYNCSASNKLGLRFTTTAISSFSYNDINNYASLYTDSIITDTLDWILLSWNFVADSGYTNLYVGNFFDDSNTDTLVISAPLGQFGYAYYYIDSLNIFCTNSNCNVGSVDFSKAQVGIFYINESNGLSVNFNHESKVSVTIINALGQICKIELLSQPKIITLPNLSKGIYYAVLQSEKKTATKKFIIY